MRQNTRRAESAERRVSHHRDRQEVTQFAWRITQVQQPRGPEVVARERIEVKDGDVRVVKVSREFDNALVQKRTFRTLSTTPARNEPAVRLAQDGGIGERTGHLASQRLDNALRGLGLQLS